MTMSSRRHKRKIGKAYIANLVRMNTVRLNARWWAIHITKDAFRTKKQKEDMKEIEKILKSRGVKPRRPKAYGN